MHSQGYKRWGNRNPNNHRQLPRPQQTAATPPAPLQQGFGPPHPHFQAVEVREGLPASRWASNGLALLSYLFSVI